MYCVYKNSYESLKSKNNPYQKIIDEYVKLNEKQEQRLDQKEKYYQALKSNFDSLFARNKSFLDVTDMRTQSINTKLDSATIHITNIKTLLDDTQRKLKKEGNNKWKFSVGGFTVGIGAMASILAIVK